MGELTRVCIQKFKEDSKLRWYFLVLLLIVFYVGSVNEAYVWGEYKGKYEKERLGAVCTTPDGVVGVWVDVDPSLGNLSGNFIIPPIPDFSYNHNLE